MASLLASGFSVRDVRETVVHMLQHPMALRGSSLLSTPVSYVVATFQMWELRFKYNLNEIDFKIQFFSLTSYISSLSQLQVAS